MTDMSPSSTTVRDPLSVFHVGGLTVSGTQASAQQQLCAQFADHRGRIDLPAFGVLFDHIGGIPFHLAGTRSGALSMQARLTMSALGHVDVDDRLTCDAQIAMHDDHTGVTPVQIRTEAGQLCCIGTRGTCASVVPPPTAPPRLRCSTSRIVLIPKVFCFPRRYRPRLTGATWLPRSRRGSATPAR